MGCCLSTTVTASPAKSPDQDLKCETKSDALLLLDEEETVKEVLSETQVPMNTTIITTNTTDKNYLKEAVGEQEEISVVSEMYSMSGSFSGTTAHEGDEAGEVDQKLFHHSPAKKRSSSRVSARARRGGLRSLEIPSSNPRVITRGYKPPGPSSQALKSRPAQARTTTACSTVHRQRSSLGLECSGQRSASEVIRQRRPAVSRVSHVTGRHPGGKSRIRKLEESKGIEDHEGDFSRESLDNPRVSLECFIFL